MKHSAGSTPHRPPDGTEAECALSREANLVQRARIDPDGFAELYDEYVERIYSFAYRRLGSHSEAEELTSRTFHRALERFEVYEWRGVPFGAWLFRIASNLVIDHRRAGGAISLDTLTEAGYDPTRDGENPTEDVAIGHEEGAAVWAAVRTLPPLQQRAISLRFGRDLSHAEVGVIIGRSEAATKQIVYRAVKRLRESLGDQS